VPPTPYTEKKIEYILDFLNTLSQYDLHQKQDDYTHTLAKEIEQSKERKSASGSKSSAKSATRNKSSGAPLKAHQATSNRKRNDVSQFRE
jgi:hypothetical protein